MHIEIHISYLNETVSDLPGKYVWVITPVIIDALLDIRRSYFARLRSADDSRPDASGFLVAVQDFRDAAVGDAQLSRNDAGTDAGRRKFHNFQSDVIRKWAAVDENSAQLIHTPLTCSSTVQISINYYSYSVIGAIFQSSLRH